jgi:hypothetical protein
MLTLFTILIVLVFQGRNQERKIILSEEYNGEVYISEYVPLMCFMHAARMNALLRN